MRYKNINASLSDEDKNTILQKLREAETLLPFVVNLSPDERRALPKMGTKTIGFVESSLGYARNHPQYVPNYLDLAEQETDMLLAKQLQSLLEVIEPLYEKIRDTYMAVGAEAYLAGRVFYDSVKAAAKSGLPGSDVISKELGTLFRKTRKKPAAETQQPTTTETGNGSNGTTG